MVGTLYSVLYDSGCNLLLVPLETNERGITDAVSYLCINCGVTARIAKSVDSLLCSSTEVDTQLEVENLSIASCSNLHFHIQSRIVGNHCAKNSSNHRR